MRKGSIVMSSSVEIEIVEASELKPSLNPAVRRSVPGGEGFRAEGARFGVKGAGDGAEGAEQGVIGAGDGVGAIVPRVKINIRAGTIHDLPFIDSLQKKHSKELGFLPTAALEGKIRLGQVLVAEVEGVGDGAGGEAVGYLIAADRYQKRDEIGYITQVAVVPELRRSLVAAALVQAQFDRSAYGCRLYCCWCAQDLRANEFWEAMGFKAIAFRTGSRTKGRGKSGEPAPRIHIFWQKRVRADDTVTPWWYPSTTGGGELREDRLVFPIPTGTSWRDVLPVVLTGEKGKATPPEPKAPKPRMKKVLVSPWMEGSLWFKHQAVERRLGPSGRLLPVKPGQAIVKASGKPEKSRTMDAKLVSAARELRDRWMEQREQVAEGVARHDVRKVKGLGPVVAGVVKSAGQMSLPGGVVGG